MIKKFVAALLSLFAAMAFAAVDVNSGTQAELESVKGIGPSIATKMMDERKKSPFKDWQDMVDRVKGIGSGNAAKFSTNGLTVNGAAYAGAPAKAAPAAKKDAAKVAAPAAATAPVAPAAPAVVAAPVAPAAKPAVAPAVVAAPAAVKALPAAAAAAASAIKK